MSSSSLPINPLSSPHSQSCPPSQNPTISLRFSSSFSTSTTTPITLLCIKSASLSSKKPQNFGKMKNKHIHTPLIAASGTSINKLGEEEEEGPPPLLDPEVNSWPKRIALFVDPSPFPAISKDFEAARLTKFVCGTRVFVNSESFHPRYSSQEMRLRLSNSEPERPLIVHAGWLGVEKSLGFLEGVMDRLPEARIAFISARFYRLDLKKMFDGVPAIFSGILQGEELGICQRRHISSAFRIRDVGFCSLRGHVIRTSCGGCSCLRGSRNYCGRSGG